MRTQAAPLPLRLTVENVPIPMCPPAAERFREVFPDGCDFSYAAMRQADTYRYPSSFEHSPHHRSDWMYSMLFWAAQIYLGHGPLGLTRNERRLDDREGFYRALYEEFLHNYPEIGERIDAGMIAPPPWRTHAAQVA